MLKELSGERANTLGRAGVRLNEALTAYASVLETGADPDRVETALTEARDAAWALVVQRECAGFRSKDFTWLREHWGVPEEVLRRI
ncbi:hypothetical protein GCM10009547_34480 [Sporichthya brevicatena]|uniref:Uncharacterized protein n=1 Tax=Sporichthya brevicatena TaxID=171442 RepID=A0ABN1H3F2_9ACTN